MQGGTNPYAAYGRSKSLRRPDGQREAFRRLIDEAKANHNISDVVSLKAKVVRAGREKVALCAFHKERTPSMRLNDAKGTFHCFGCGKSGDIVTYVMEVEGLDFMSAMRWLGAADLPAVDPNERRKAAEEDAAERAAAIAEARAVWDKAVPAAGTVAETYLRSRAITMSAPPCFRFVETYAWRDQDTGEVGPDYPALVCAVTLVDGSLIGLQRIFLRPDGSGKAGFKKPKRSLGRVKGGAIRIGDPGAAEIITTEGPEDALSLAQELRRTVYATLGTAMMPFVQYPPCVRSIVIAGQNDSAGRKAVDAAAPGLSELQYAVRTMFPSPGFKDWNDELRGIRS